MKPPIIGTSSRLIVKSESMPSLEPTPLLTNWGPSCTPITTPSAIAITMVGKVTELVNLAP